MSKADGKKRLEGALAKLASRGFDKLEAADAGERELELAIDHARAFVENATSDPDLQRELEAGLDVIQTGGPILAGAARSELRELFSSAFLAVDGGYPEGIGEMAFAARRSAMRAVTVEAAGRARARAERLAFVGDLLETLGGVALKLLPLLIAAL